MKTYCSHFSMLEAQFRGANRLPTECWFFIPQQLSLLYPQKSKEQHTYSTSFLRAPTPYKGFPCLHHLSDYSPLNVIRTRIVFQHWNTRKYTKITYSLSNYKEITSQLWVLYQRRALALYQIFIEIH